MKIQDDDLSKPSYKSSPTTFKIYPCNGLKLVSCVIGLIIICILLSKVNITIIINLKENQSHTTPLSTAQLLSTQFPPTSNVTDKGIKMK